MYPQQIVEFGILNAAVYWLRQNGIHTTTRNARFDGIGELQFAGAEED